MYRKLFVPPKYKTLIVKLRLIWYALRRNFIAHWVVVLKVLATLAGIVIAIWGIDSCADSFNAHEHAVEEQSMKVETLRCEQYGKELFYYGRLCWDQNLYFSKQEQAAAGLERVVCMDKNGKVTEKYIETYKP